MTGAFDLLVWATILPVLIVLIIGARKDQEESAGQGDDAAAQPVSEAHKDEQA